MRRPQLAQLGLHGVGSLLALGLGVAAFYLVAQPLYQRALALPALHGEQHELNETCRQLADRNRLLRAKLGALAQRIEAERRHAILAESDVMRLIAETCAAVEITLVRIEPAGGGAIGGAKLAHRLRVTGHGAYPRFHQLLARLETASPYLHIDELRIAMTKVGGDPRCEFSWTVGFGPVANSAGGVRS